MIEELHPGRRQGLWRVLLFSRQDAAPFYGMAQHPQKGPIYTCHLNWSDFGVYSMSFPLPTGAIVLIPPHVGALILGVRLAARCPPHPGTTEPVSRWSGIANVPEYGFCFVANCQTGVIVCQLTPTPEGDDDAHE